MYPSNICPGPGNIWLWICHPYAYLMQNLSLIPLPYTELGNPFDTIGARMPCRVCWKNSCYSKGPTWSDSFNANIGSQKYALGLEILTKTFEITRVWFGDLNFGTFCLISLDSLHIFQNWFLHWNRELEPVVLSTMSPINGTKKCLSYKGPIWS